MNKQPAIFSPIKEIWIKEAMDYFSQGNRILYFYTDSNLISKAEELDVGNIYFKVKGENYVCAVAEFVDLTTINPKNNRLSSSVNVEGKYYYGFKNLKLLKNKIPLDEIKHYPSGLVLRDDTPGPCIVYDLINYETK